MYALNKDITVTASKIKKKNLCEMKKRIISLGAHVHADTRNMHTGRQTARFCQSETQII